jgi:7-cyano-7-deazaguanine synthase
LNVLVLLSGGVDSAACVEYYVSRGHNVTALHINYGQPHWAEEQAAASSVATYFKIPLRQLSITGLSFTEGYIPSRNAILLCLGLLVSCEEFNLIALGIHADTSYVDCSPEFVQLMQNVFNLYEQGRTRVAAPFLTWTKNEIWDYASVQNVPLHMTYSSNPSYFQSEELLKMGE